MNVINKSCDNCAYDGGRIQCSRCKEQSHWKAKPCEDKWVNLAEELIDKDDVFGDNTELMTREEIIDIFKCLAYHDLRPSEKVIDEAIKSLEQEPCEDAVSRKRVELLVKFYDLHKSCLTVDNLRKDVANLPSVTPIRKKAHNNNEDYAECDQFVCSNCGIELQDWHRVERDEDDGEISYHEYRFKYCPNCGAEMESEDK